MYFMSAKTLSILITQRFLWGHRRDTKTRIEFSKEELISGGVLAMNGILRERHLNKYVWGRVKSGKIFLMHEKTGRIMAELKIFADETGYGMFRRPLMELVDKRGKRVDASLEELADIANGLGIYKRKGDL